MDGHRTDGGRAQVSLHVTRRIRVRRSGTLTLTSGQWRPSVPRHLNLYFKRSGAMPSRSCAPRSDRPMGARSRGADGVAQSRSLCQTPGRGKSGRGYSFIERNRNVVRGRKLGVRRIVLRYIVLFCRRARILLSKLCRTRRGQDMDGVGGRNTVATGVLYSRSFPRMKNWKDTTTTIKHGPRRRSCLGGRSP